MAKRKTRRPATRPVKAAKKPAQAAKTTKPKPAKKKPANKKPGNKKPATKKPTKKTPAKATKKQQTAKAALKPKLTAASEPGTSTMPRQRWARRSYVGIRLFSGAPNPRWVLPDPSFQELEHALLQLPPRMEAPNRLVANSLYGGMVLHLVHANGSRRGFLVHDEHVFDSATDVVRRDAGRKIEEHLFGTMPIDLNNALRSRSEDLAGFNFETVKAPRNEQFGVFGAKPGQDTPRCDEGPSFQAPPPKSEWDSFPGIEDNNCYNYANNQFSEIDDAQPGRTDFNPLTEEEMHRLLLKDRLVPVGPDRKKLPEACVSTAGAHLLAVCLRSPDGTKKENGAQVQVYGDYHCFRLDANGRWSHKDGSLPSTNADNRGNTLSDLSAAFFKVEHVLVGYYWSIPGQRLIGMPQ
jgi:hypothetical protein